MDEIDEPQSDGGLGAGLIAKLPLILWERRWLVIIPAVLLTIAGAAAALLLPPSYQSRAVVLVESDSIAGQAATPGGDIDRRIAKIRQQLVSRPDLVELIQQLNLYNASSRAEPLSKLVDRLRDATVIAPVEANIARGPGKQSSIAFQLTVDYPEPGKAQAIAQTFIDRLLSLSASQVQSDAAGLVRLLEGQETTLQEQLTGIESKIAQITGQNGSVLSGAGGGIPSISLGSNYETQIAGLERENAQLRAQTGGVAVERDAGVIAAQAQLEAVRAQYSDDHPDVRLAENRVAAARAAAASLQTRAVSGTIQQQINVNNSTIAQLRAAKAAEQGRALQLQAAQSRGPLIAAQVSQLQQQADQVRGQLGRVSAQLLDARSTAKVTEEQRGERLTLIEPPVSPDTPTSPNRPLIAGGGLVGGVGLGLGLALLIELVTSPIRSAGSLTRITGAPPLAVVPVMSKKRYNPNRLARKRNKKRKKGFWPWRKTPKAI